MTKATPIDRLELTRRKMAFKANLKAAVSNVSLSNSAYPGAEETQEQELHGDLCPFCGGEIKSEIKTFGDYRILFFHCQNKDCGAVISFNSGKTYKDYMKAIEAWNRRANNG